MIALWYALVALLLAAYVVLDGFDLGAGILHLLLARKDAERRAVLQAIGPFWDGNEVCLLAAGGALFVAFPTALASGLSGFALAIFLVLWSLILRGISIEFRSHVGDPLWRAAWDAVFCGASSLLPVLLGAALGNILRGLPLDARSWFELPLFTDFSARAPVGVLDWYTVTTGVFALVALAAHGALFLAWRAAPPVHERASRIARPLWLATAVLWAIAIVATLQVNPDVFRNLRERPLAWLASAAALVAFLGAGAANRRGRDRLAFGASALFLGALLGATAASLYPTLLRGVGEESPSLLAPAAAAPPHSLAVGIGWFAVGAPFAVAWFVLQFRLHRPRTPVAPEGEGY